MMPIGPLMIEHRLIEKMIALMRRAAARIEHEDRADPSMVNLFVDFIRNYADRCHHGKEEGLLFRELDKKPLSGEHRKIMNELIDEHVFARRATARMYEANERYSEQKEHSLPSIIENIRQLTNFYPPHIEKEDQHFFLPVMQYFSDEEKESMLQEEYEFGRNLIHGYYNNLVANAEELLK